MTCLEPQDWSFPIPIAYGPGRLREIAEFCHQAGMARPLIVTDRTSSNLPFMTDLRQILKAGGIEHGVYSAISPNPRDDEIILGRAQFLGDSHDGVIAIGGGSSMDGGKAICLVAHNDIDLWDFEFERPSPDMAHARAFPPLICIPTTAGTGAETESTAMITDTGQRMKFCVWHTELKPSFALLDPELTVGLPAHLTAWTGVDAMVHAIEAYCVPGFHPLCDGLALEALRLISNSLTIAVEQPSNLEARGSMLVGSSLAGISFLKGLGLVHAISHMIGAEYDTQHGLTNAILLPTVLRHNATAISSKIGPMAQAMGLDDTSFDRFYRHICELLDRLSIADKLTDIGVDAECARRIAEKAIKDSAAATNPRPLTVASITSVIQNNLEHGRGRDI